MYYVVLPILSESQLTSACSNEFDVTSSIYMCFEILFTFVSILIDFNLFSNTETDRKFDED